MTKFNMGDRYNWRRSNEVQHIIILPLRKLPIRFNSGPTPRHAVLDFVQLVVAYPDVEEP